MTRYDHARAVRILTVIFAVGEVGEQSDHVCGVDQVKPRPRRQRRRRVAVPSRVGRTGA